MPSSTLSPQDLHLFGRMTKLFHYLLDHATQLIRPHVGFAVNAGGTDGTRSKQILGAPGKVFTRPTFDVENSTELVSMVIIQVFTEPHV